MWVESRFVGKREPANAKARHMAVSFRILHVIPLQRSAKAAGRQSNEIPWLQWIHLASEL